MFEATEQLVHTSFMRSSANAVQAAKERIPVYEDAYDGVYQVYLPKKVMVELANRLGIKTNLCARVVDAMVSKLDLKSISAATPELQKVFDEEYEYNQMELQTTEVHRMTAIDGDCYVLVWPEYVNGKETGHAFIRTLAAPDVDMIYSPADKLLPIRCVRQWNDEEQGMRLFSKVIVRRDTMTPLTIHREYSMPGEGNVWHDWTFDGLLGTVENPLKTIPVVHFRNKVGGKSFGRSELEDALPIQQDINRLVQDAMIRSYYNGGQQIALFGVDKAEFDKNNKTGLSREAWEMWMFDSENASLTTIPPQILADMWNSVDKRINHLGWVTGTPMSYLSPSAAISGAALQEMSGPLTDKVYEAQTVLGSSWSRLFSLVLQICTGTSTPVHVEWEDPFVQTTIDDDLKMFAAGAISHAEFLRRQGMNEAQIANIIAERQAEQKAASTSMFQLPDLAMP